MNNIIANYLMKNILLVFLAIFLIITFLLFGNAFTVVLQSSLEPNLSITSLIQLVVIRLLRDTPLIINLAFFLAVTITINKLYKDAEMSAIHSAGIGDFHLFKKVLPLTVIMTLIIAIISMLLVPYSDTIKQQIINKHSNTSQLNFIKTEEFQTFQNGNIVLYIDSGDNQLLGKIFVYSNIKGNKNVTVANSTTRHTDNNGNIYLRLKDGARYNGFLNLENKKILNFESFDIKIISGIQQNIPNDISASGQSMTTLLSNLTPQNIAELQWRLSPIMSLFIMAFIAILLAKSSPRNETNLGILWGVIIFAIYLNLLKSARNEIDDYELISLSSILFVHLGFICLATLLYLYHNNKLKRFTQILS